MKTAQYRSTTTIQLDDIDLAAVFLAQNLQQQGQDARTKAATTARLILLPSVRRAAAKTVGGGATANSIGGQVSVQTDTDTTLIEIQATDPDPARAKAVADAVRSAFIARRTANVTTQLNSAKRDLRAQLAAIPPEQRGGEAAAALNSRLGQLNTLTATAGAGVITVEPATVPEGSIAPKPKRNAILGLIVGFLVGTGIAVWLAARDTSVGDEEELGELWDLSVLGTIPLQADLARNPAAPASAPLLEAFALARSNLRYSVTEADRTLLVTSAQAGEGKSTVVWNLALAAASTGVRVLVIDADLRRPALAKMAGVANRSGLSEVLAGITPLEGAIVDVESKTAGGERTVVSLLPSGLVPPNPLALLDRPRTKAILEKAAAAYDLVLIDSPPATVVADAGVLAGHVDGILVVARVREVNRGQFQRLRQLLEATGRPVLGVVVNGGADLAHYSYEPSARPAAVRP